MGNYIIHGDKLYNLDELYHYGVKGMKWGVIRTPEQLGHKPLKKRTTNTSAKKTNIDDLTDRVSKSFKRNKYGWNTAEFKNKVGDVDNVNISIYADKTVDKNHVKNTLKRLNDYDSKKAKEDLAKYYYDSGTVKNWDSKISRDEFKNKIELVRVSSDAKSNTISYWYKDGGTFGGHAIEEEIDISDGRVRARRLFG